MDKDIYVYCQKNRFKSHLIKNANFNVKEIINALKKTSSAKNKKINKFFGEGTSARKFEKIVSRKSFWNTEIQKGFIDRGYFDITN